MKLISGIILGSSIAFIVLIWLWGGGLDAISNNNGKNIDSITALFGGFAFVCMAFALFLQSRELSLQRKELELTRNELQRAAAAAEENLEQQRKISDKRNSYTKNQILVQKYVAEIEFIYKQVEYSSVNHSHRMDKFKEKESEIQSILKKINDLKTIDGPIDG